MYLSLSINISSLSLYKSSRILIESPLNKALPWLKFPLFTNVSYWLSEHTSVIYICVITFVLYLFYTWNNSIYKCECENITNENAKKGVYGKLGTCLYWFHKPKFVSWRVNGKLSWQRLLRRSFVKSQIISYISDQLNTARAVSWALPPAVSWTLGKRSVDAFYSSFASSRGSWRRLCKSAFV